MCLAAQRVGQWYTACAGLDRCFRSEAEALQAGAKLRAGDSEERRCVRLVTFGVCQSGQDGAPFETRQRLRRRVLRRLTVRGAPSRLSRPADPEMFRREETTLDENQGTLDRILQLPGVAGPGMRTQQVFGVLTQGRLPSAEPGTNLPDEMTRQEDHIVSPLP